MDEAEAEAEAGTTVFDQVIDGEWQSSAQLHQTAQDVTIVAATAGEEDTDWIKDFCDE